MEKHINPEYKKQILKAIAYHFPDAKVILFGSRARGTHKEGADVDVAIQVKEPIELGEMARARVTLENLPIPLEVDLVNLDTVPEELKHVILREGIVL